MGVAGVLELQEFRHYLFDEFGSLDNTFAAIRTNTLSTRLLVYSFTYHFIL